VTVDALTRCVMLHALIVTLWSCVSVVKYCPGGDRESKSEVPSQTKREMLKRLK
jgi:hypothetical protein